MLQVHLNKVNFNPDTSIPVPILNLRRIFYSYVRVGNQTDQTCIQGKSRLPRRWQEIFSRVWYVRYIHFSKAFFDGLIDTQSRVRSKV